MKITRKTPRVGIPNVAMGDIAFNLLIFFVILAQAQDDSHLKWLPASSEKLESAGHSKVSILVDVDSKVYLNGQQVGIGQLEAEIGALLEGRPVGERRVLLKIDKETQAIIFEPIIEAVSKVGGEIVHVLEEDKT